MADVVAITAYAQFWFPGLSDWVASLAVILLLLGLNLATVKMFGEMEFWFAMIKNRRHRGADRGRPGDGDDAL